jgi:chemotaxis response regulator CheB
MAAIKVFIISDSLAFSEGLKSLLHEKAEVKVIGQDNDVIQALPTIKKQKPQVVIWASTGLKWASAGKERMLLKTVPTLRMISLNLQNNEITIYHSAWKGMRLVHEAQDLTLAIKESLLPRPASAVRQFMDIFISPPSPPSLLNQS